MLRNRTFKIHILTLFLSLNLAALLLMILFIHIVNHKFIVKASEKATLRTAALVLEKIKEIELTVEHLAQSTAGFIHELGPITPENKIALSYFLNTIKYQENLSEFFIGLGNGGFFGVYNKTDTALKKFSGVSANTLYPQTAFLLHYNNTNQHPPSDQWFFFNNELRLLGSINNTLPGYDARLRPWYIAAKKIQAPFWVETYLFLPGITIGTPVFDTQGNITAVVGAEISFSLLDNFLNSLIIGQNGKVSILDNKGNIITPALSKHSPVLRSLFRDAFSYYQRDPSQSHFIFEKNGIEYLAYVGELPIFTQKKWKLTMVVPLNDFFGNLIIMQKELLGICVLILCLSILIIYHFSKRISHPILTIAQEILKIGKLQLDSKISVHSSIREITMIEEATQSLKRGIGYFARYVPKEIVKMLLQKNEAITLGGEKSDVTILFSDIANFTSIMETHPIDFLLPLLKEYFEMIAPVILQHQGTIDKFIGDGVMAFWGAPVPLSDHVTKACIATLICQKTLFKMNETWRKEGKPVFLTRFGINTGSVIVGNFGTEDRMNYTIIGDAVNTAARLQDINKTYHTTIIISQDIYTKLDTSFITRPLDLTVVKGKKEKIKIYELYGNINGEEAIQPTDDEIKLCTIFTEAYNALEQGERLKAKALFLSIQEKYPNDYPTMLYLKQLC